GLGHPPLWAGAHPPLAPLRADRLPRPRDLAGPCVLPPGAHGPGWPVVRDAQVPLDAEGCGGGERASMGPRRRPAADPPGPHPPAVLARRAAPALERAEGGHEHGGAAAGAAILRPPVQDADPSVHAPPQGEVRPDRVGPGEWPAGQHLAREAHRVRPLLHPELVAGPRREGPAPHPLSRLAASPCALDYSE